MSLDNCYFFIWLVISRRHPFYGESLHTHRVKVYSVLPFKVANDPLFVCFFSVYFRGFIILFPNFGQKYIHLLSFVPFWTVRCFSDYRACPYLASELYHVRECCRHWL